MLEALGIHYEPNVITTIGLIVAAAFLGSKLFQRYGIPQVVGFIVMGVLLGSSGFNLVPHQLAEELTFISEIAVGLIGFDMGSHLRISELRQLGRSIIFILLCESLGTFLLVTLGIYFVTQDWITALLFGALSSATAPAATIDVLAEYDAKGPLTTSIIAVVGLDDALALLLFSVIASTAESMFAHTAAPSLWQIISLPLVEIGGSIILGAVMGLALDSIMSRMKKHHDAMAVSIGFVLLCVGLSNAFSCSLILTTMILGFVVVNRHDEHSKQIRYTIEQAGPVIYVLFFALVGARFRIDLLPTMGFLGIAYVLLRSLGKFAGAWTGSALGGAVPAVRNNLGLSLLSQAGVAVGLAIAASCRFSVYGTIGELLGQTIINVITATTFIVQIIGPIGVKFAINRADEIGKARLSDEVWASEGIPK
ncbi:MAG: cation:proton antiporter [Anaerolineae bacterium]